MLLRSATTTATTAPRTIRSSGELCLESVEEPQRTAVHGFRDSIDVERNESIVADVYLRCRAVGLLDIPLHRVQCLHDADVPRRIDVLSNDQRDNTVLVYVGAHDVGEHIKPFRFSISKVTLE